MRVTNVLRSLTIHELEVFPRR